MNNVYARPVAEIISFAPSKPIALEEPGWGWEEDVFSTTEARSFDDAERRGLNEE